MSKPQVSNLKLDYTINGVRVIGRHVTRYTADIYELVDRDGVSGKNYSFELALSEYLDNLSFRLGAVVTDARLYP